MEDQMFKEKVQLILDSYFDREFFTNLIYCMDRKKTVREIFEASVRELDTTKKWSGDLDKSLLHLFYAYQASSLIRENYQWLPVANALYACSLHRGDGQKPVEVEAVPLSAGRASTVEEFASLIRRDVRGVESKAAAWGSLLFLLDNRTTRAPTISVLIREALTSSDIVTFELLVRALEVSLSSGWRSTGVYMRRAFDRFWHSEKAPAIVDQARLLSQGAEVRFTNGPILNWDAQRSDELWRRVAEQGVESVWEFIRKAADSGASYDQVSSLLLHLRGRVLFSMNADQWPRVARSIVYAESLQAAASLMPDQRSHFLAVNVFDLVQVVQLIGAKIPARPTGQSILDGVSQTISKDRLVLRLDDAAERGDRSEALELIAVILKDEGLSSSVSDRLLLMASKQDSWTYDLKTLPVAFVLTKSFSSCVRLSVKGDAILDGLYGLLRFFCDQRETALTVVPKTGTYGNGLSLSQFDVSGGARVVDRFVFNQMRNAQRVKVWPSDN